MFQGWVGIDFSDWAVFVGLGSAAAASVEVPVISLVDGNTVRRVQHKIDRRKRTRVHL